MKVRDVDGNVLEVSGAYAMRMVEQGKGTIVAECEAEPSAEPSAEDPGKPESAEEQRAPGTEAGTDGDAVTGTGAPGKKAGKRK